MIKRLVILILFLLLPIVSQAQTQCPTLMFHHIRSAKHIEGQWGRDLSCEPATFRKHLDYIQQQRYTTTTFEDLAKGIRVNKPIILTFDDGNSDQWIAFKELRQRNMKGVFFIYTSNLGHSGYFSESEIKAIANSGMETGSHSVTHSILPKLRYNEQKYEIVHSKEVLETIIGKPVVAFCYPFGQYNRTAIHILKRAGYKYARTTNEAIWNLEEIPFEIPIIYIHLRTKTLKGII